MMKCCFLSRISRGTLDQAADPRSGGSDRYCAETGSIPASKILVARQLHPMQLFDHGRIGNAHSSIHGIPRSARPTALGFQSISIASLSSFREQEPRCRSGFSILGDPSDFGEDACSGQSVRLNFCGISSAPLRSPRPASSATGPSLIEKR